MQIKTKKFRNKTDLIVVVSLPVFAAITTVLFSLPFLYATILFFGLPALYLSKYHKSSLPRVLLFATATAIFGGIIIDYFANADSAWFVPSIFSIHFFRYVPIEDILWCFMLVYYIAIFYLHFFVRRTQHSLGKHMKLYLLLGSSIFAVFTISVLALKSLPVIPYFYFWGFMLVIVAPLIAFVITWPQYTRSLVIVALYFTYVCLLQEFVSLRMGHWFFFGTHYIGWVGSGLYRFPIEELVLYIILFAPSLVTYLLFFTDDKINYAKIGKF